MTHLRYLPGHAFADADGWVDLDALGDYFAKAEKKQKGKRVHVVSDTMATPLQHMATGKFSDSKSEHRRMTKESGCVEVGNDSSLLRQRKPAVLDRAKRRDDIRRAIYELRNR